MTPSPHPSPERTRELVSKFSSLRILCVGDLMLDAYIWGKVNRISPEAPIPVVEVTREEQRPGGAANVGLNILGLGARASFAGLVGRDPAAASLRDYLGSRGADVSAILESTLRSTTVKTRVLAQHQQVVRIDRETNLNLASEEEKNLLEALNPLIPKADGIILSDYNKGVLSKSFVASVMNRAQGRIVTVDPKPQNMRLFKGASLITPNKKETEAAVGFALDSEAAVERASAQLRSELALGATLITRGEEGMSLHDGKTHLHIPTRANLVYDVTGAGDTVISVATLALCAGATPAEAAMLSNIAAGITVAHLGVYAVSQEELIEAMLEA